MGTETIMSRIQAGGIRRWLSGYGFIIIFLGIFLAYVIISGGALTANGVLNILRHSAVVGLMSFGMGLVILTGGIDLSVGSMLALVGGFSVDVYNATNNVWLTLAFALVAGALCGFVNGFLVGIAKMPPFIVTLATMLIFRSICLYYLRTQGKSIYSLDGTLSSYKGFYGFGQGFLLGIPNSGWVLVAVTVVMVFLCVSTKYGKAVYAIGSNEKAARLAGINIDWIRVSVFVITGVLTGLAAFLWLAMNGSVDAATVGRSNEMYAIAAVVIGGISMAGGKGKILGVLFGTMSYTIIDKIIASAGFDALINDAIKGSILIVAVLVQIVIPKIRGRARRDTGAPARPVPDAGVPEAGPPPAVE